MDANERILQNMAAYGAFGALMGRTQRQRILFGAWGALGGALVGAVEVAVDNARRLKNREWRVENLCERVCHLEEEMDGVKEIREVRLQEQQLTNAELDGEPVPA